MNTKKIKEIAEKLYESNGADGVGTKAIKRLQRAAFVEGYQKAFEWQPIETAPRDGAWVLITDYEDVDDQNEYTFVAKWATSPGNGCWLINAYMNSYIPNPTHWMPLPSPPKISTK